MKKLTFVLALSLIAIAFLCAPSFAQTDDNDGDGIPNSEDLCPGSKGTRVNKGCPAGEKEAEPVVAATPKPIAIPAQTPRPVSAPTSPALADCRNIIEDAGCRKFYGKSGEELRAVLGQTPKNGVVPQLGIWFYMWAPTSDGTPTVAEVTFYGTDVEDLKRFYGNPGEKIDWTATSSDVIRAYGKPTKESPWTYEAKSGLTLSYGSNLTLEFENEKLIKVTIRWPQHDDDTAAYFEKLKKDYADEQAAKQKSVAQETARQKAESDASQMMTDYETLLDQLEAKLREGDRIIKSEMTAIAAGGIFAKAVQKKLDRVTASGDALIEQFGKKYQGKITAAMVKRIRDLWRPTPFPN